MTKPVAAGEMLGHPKGLFLLFGTEMWERMSYYGMRGIFVLYLVAFAGSFGWDMAYFGIDPNAVDAEEQLAKALNKNALGILGVYAFWVYVTPVLGGWMADKMGGAKVTQYVAIVMIASALGVAYFLKAAYQSATPEEFFVPFLILFLVLFAATGIGNGSTFRTIAMVFPKEQAGPALGWTSAVAAYGAFLIPKIFGEQIKLATPEVALYGFAVFYAVCLLLNWWYYLSPKAEFKNP